jgi:hypothetical protein
VLAGPARVLQAWGAFLRWRHGWRQHLIPGGAKAL